MKEISFQQLKNISKHLTKEQNLLTKVLAYHKSFKQANTGEKIELEPLWDFRDQRCDNLAFVECDMRCADFTSSDISEVYFDACQWNQQDKPQQYCHLQEHQAKIDDFKKAEEDGCQGYGTYSISETTEYLSTL